MKFRGGRYIIIKHLVNLIAHLKNNSYTEIFLCFFLYMLFQNMSKLNYKIKLSELNKLSFNVFLEEILSL